MREEFACLQLFWLMARLECWPWMMILILGTYSVLELEEGSHVIFFHDGKGVEKRLSDGQKVGDGGGGSCVTVGVMVIVCQVGVGVISTMLDSVDVTV